MDIMTASVRERGYFGLDEIKMLSPNSVTRIATDNNATYKEHEARQAIAASQINEVPTLCPAL